jgi:hypothetical protein
MRAITSQHEQYGVTIHLFIGTGHSLGEITFMSVTFTISQKVSCRGLSSFSPLDRFHFPSPSLCYAEASSSTALELVHPSSRSRLSYYVHFHLEAEVTRDSILYWKIC